VTDVQTALHPGDLDLAGLLDILGYQDNEHVSLNGIKGGRFTARVCTVAEAIEHAPEFTDKDLWFGVNPIGLAAGSKRRGRSADVTRLAALIIELDDAKLSKPAQVKLIDDITAILGSAPAAVVLSGHGQHVYWPINVDDAAELSNPAAAVLAARWGHLIGKLGARFRGTIDSVFDLSRVLRVPGSTNCKDAAKVPVTGYRQLGKPLRVAELIAALDAHGIPEIDETEAVRDVVSAPGEWTYVAARADVPCKWLRAKADGWQTDEIAKRHPWLISQSIKLHCALRAGCVGDQQQWTDLKNELQAAFMARIAGDRAPTPDEFEAAMREGERRTACKTGAEVLAEIGGEHAHKRQADDAAFFSRYRAAQSGETMTDTDTGDGFWSQTPILAHIRTFARSRTAAPYVVLGSVLRRVAGCIGPEVVLPPIGAVRQVSATAKGVASLNLFTIPVALSGGGKDSGNDAGHDAVGLYNTFCGSLAPADEAKFISPGSGEGLARIFKNGETAAHLQVPDVATLEALAGRKGQTLVGQLLQGFSGQALGFNNNNKETTTSIEAHSYRLCLSVGVQPENAGFFLSREHCGLPQRFLWLPSVDTGALPRRPAEPVTPLQIELPTFKPALELDDTGTCNTGRCVMPVPDSVADEIWEFQYRTRIGAAGIDPLDGHAHLTRLKVAAALDILHGRTEVTEEGWRIAGQLMEVSTQTRDNLRAVVAERERRENAARARSQADREDIAATRKVAKAKAGILAQIEKLEPTDLITRAELRRHLRSDLRNDCDPAINELLDEQRIRLGRADGDRAYGRVHVDNPSSGE
jgi:hypothetical protein